MRIPGTSCLLQERWQVGSVLRIEEVATPGEEATNAYRILRNFVTTHRARAFFDPPVNGALSRFALEVAPQVRENVARHRV